MGDAVAVRKGKAQGKESKVADKGGVAGRIKPERGNPKEIKQDVEPCGNHGGDGNLYRLAVEVEKIKKEKVAGLKEHSHQ